MTELPTPLVPADADLRGLPFMPLDVVRLTNSDLVALSTGEEFKAAVILWAKCWLQVPAASLPDDDRILAHLSGAGARWKKVKEMALRGWVKCDDGRLYHQVIATKAIEAWERRQDYQADREGDRERLRKWREAKRLKRVSANKETVSKPVSPTAGNADETSKTGTGTGTGTEEDTEFCLSTESDSEKPSSTLRLVAREKKSRAKSMGTRLPNDFVVPDEWRSIATEARTRHGLPPIDTGLEADKFTTFWTSKGPNATKRNWHRVFINWCLNARGTAHVNGTGPATAIVAGFAEALAEREENRRRGLNPDGSVLVRK